MLGRVLGSAVLGTAATTHLMLPTPLAQCFHTIDFINWVTGSNASGMPPAKGGTISAPHGPGLGLEVREESLGEPFFEVG